MSSTLATDLFEHVAVVAADIASGRQPAMAPLAKRRRTYGDGDDDDHHDVSSHGGGVRAENGPGTGTATGPGPATDGPLRLLGAIVESYAGPLEDLLTARGAVLRIDVGPYRRGETVESIRLDLDRCEIVIVTAIEDHRVGFRIVEERFSVRLALGASTATAKVGADDGSTEAEAEAEALGAAVNTRYVVMSPEDGDDDDDDEDVA